MYVCRRIGQRRKRTGTIEHGIQGDQARLLKIAQNVAQPVLLSKLMHYFYHGKTWPKNCELWATQFFFNFPKLSNVHSYPMGENSTNLVTLLALLIFNGAKRQFDLRRVFKESIAHTGENI
jgi:hypothetical protein